MKKLILITIFLQSCGHAGAFMNRDARITKVGKRSQVQFTEHANTQNDHGRKHADKLMAQRCPAGFSVVEEGEVMEGATTMGMLIKHKIRETYFKFECK